MPSLSPTMTQGNITQWKKKEGDSIGPGQILADIETDKATIEWEAQEEGFVAKLLVPSGAKDVALGSPVLVLVEDAESVAAFKDFVPGAASSAKPAAEPKPSAASSKPVLSLPTHDVLNMPALSPTMSQGNILEWSKKVGDSVAPGDVLCEVETDKATIAWEAQEEGYVAAIFFPGGTKDVPIGSPVLVLVDDKGSVAAFKDITPDSLAAFKSSAPSKPTVIAAAPATPAPITASPIVKAPIADKGVSSNRVIASPYARKLAAEAGLDLGSISGSGPEGRIVAEDVQSAIQRGATKAAVAAPPPPSPASTPATTAAAAATGLSYTDVPHTQIRRVTAARLLESKQTIPHYYLTAECHVDALLQAREIINSSQANASSSSTPAPVKLSVNDFVIKAAALALKKVPGVNASWNAEYIRNFNNVDISIAVQTPSGLQVPIVKDADKKGLGSISGDVRSLAAKAKEGKLRPEEFIGGTFTISNLGMYGVKQFAAIVNPPQSAILAVGATDKKVVVAGGSAGGFKEVSTMMVTLSCDHRVIDGAMGAQWLQAFKQYIENPYSMLL
eukprot:CAMPEP_0175084724 /NCGR_PEP_ID=MMETSP0052_2-20121109/28233_1 /TAXON_ID=51329 ORGANISM="Polytomella parva, Strain SAG 63-3" /NCGR_SAMPLE_ID=MMETSP0052_2 /ASSEMBLY_ACC=CAM_ASM_000194 /LENGTH=559 /DNA_ID=CAMNT_0016356589 /DNA_START=257 /DNA_END=1939 /DNA_ORIENTATION=-